MHKHTRFARIGARFALLFSFVAGSACAFPVTWTLSGATFADGGTATGSFVFDVDEPGGQILDTFSVSVSGGDTVTFPPITYDPSNSSGFVAEGGSGNTGTVLSQNGNQPTRGIRMPAVSDLTDAGGTLALNIAGLGQGECYNCGPARAFVSGSLVGTAPPTITSAANAAFSIGANVAFTVTATGAPPPAVSVTGALPPGITFTDNGDGTGSFAGSSANAGVYPLTIVASNGIAPDASQAFTLTIRAPQALVSAPTLGEFGLFVCAVVLLLAGALRLGPNRSSLGD
jgi:hypothetical protein